MNQMTSISKPKPSPLITTTLPSGDTIDCFDLRISQWEPIYGVEAEAYDPKEILRQAKDGEIASAQKMWPDVPVIHLDLPCVEDGSTVWTITAFFHGPVVNDHITVEWALNQTENPEAGWLCVIWRQSEPYSGASEEVLAQLAALDWDTLATSRL